MVSPLTQFPKSKITNEPAEQHPTGKSDKYKKETESNIYLLGRIVVHGIFDEDMKYHVPWCGYSAKDDTYKKESDIPDHIFKRYWKQHRQKRVQKRVLKGQ